VSGGVRRGELRRGSRVLRWIEAGSGAPSVVLETGAESPATTWDPILGPLADRFRVVVYDRAGYGLSDPAAELTLDPQIGDLEALAAEIGGACVVVGHSWGGLPGRGECAGRHRRFAAPIAAGRRAPVVPRDRAADRNVARGTAADAGHYVHFGRPHLVLQAIDDVIAESRRP